MTELGGIGRIEMDVGTWCVDQIAACLSENPMGVSLKEAWRWCSYRPGDSQEIDWSDFASALEALEHRGILQTDRDAGGNIKWVRRGAKWPAEKRGRR